MSIQDIKITKIIRMGTSLGIIIPSQTVKGMGWQRGDHIIFGYTGDNYLTVKRPSDVELRLLKELKTGESEAIKKDGTRERIQNDEIIK